MSDTTQTEAPVTADHTEAATDTAGFDAAAGFTGAAAFADAETREILNLLGDQDGAGSCCGGACCSA